MKNNMLNKLKSHYEDLEIKPSSDLWSRLDDKLGNKPEGVFKESLQWWKYAAVLLLFVSVGIVFYFNTEKKSFNYKETDYIVKKGLEKTVNPINPELQNQVSSDKSETIINSKANKVKITRYQKKKSDSSLDKTTTEKKFKTLTTEVRLEHLAAEQDIKTDITSAKIENHIPVIAQEKSGKPTYINSNELLLGREFDKARETSQKNDIKLGIFNFEKPKPKVENVTVLGVTVYVDPK
ncbi:hypothetical protein [Chryseobacterium takakiae]|uniref:Uncharacterized protein n=1 Tax=Chryseobacterium takakiae TaxID=1302685 RepID=A0A1M4SSY1_9FLAO|nr:hypothetical protein [Chryseobacterium takakiae]SHE35117.1 hypothetical protein SAMN05444408_10119 [Chryseobacterium takakiae]